jgi:hypothetical protein
MYKTLADILQVRPPGANLGKRCKRLQRDRIADRQVSNPKAPQPNNMPPYSQGIAQVRGQRSHVKTRGTDQFQVDILAIESQQFESFDHDLPSCSFNFFSLAGQLIQRLSI